MATNYQRGANFEYRVKRALEKLGFVVVRSAGSKTPADLVAGRLGTVLLVQCTTLKECKREQDRNRLMIMAAFFGAVPVLVWKEKERGPLVWEFLYEQPDSVLDIC